MPTFHDSPARVHSNEWIIQGAYLTRRSWNNGRRQLLHVGEHGIVEIDLELSEDSLTLRVLFATLVNRDLDPLEVTVCVRAAASVPIQVDGLDSPLRSALVAGLHTAYGASDLYSLLYAKIYRCVVHQDTRDDRSSTDLPFVHDVSDGTGGHELQYCSSIVASMRIVYSVLREAAIHTVGLLDRTSVRVALPFSPCARLWVYEKLVQDWSGRLTQLAAACPGLILFAFAMDEHEPLRPVAENILSDAIAGVRVNRIASMACSAWAYLARDMAIEEGGGDRARPWRRLQAAETGERAHMRKNQEFLVRTASPRTAPSFLLLPPPLALVLDDVPRGVWNNARWQRTMKTALELVAPRPEDDPEVFRGLSQFSSRWSRELHPAGYQSRIHRKMSRLVRFARHAEVRINRLSSPRRVLADCDDWHAVAYRGLEFNRPGGADATQLTTKLTGQQLDEWSDHRVTAERITTVGELLREGHRQRNCVGQRVGRALGGSVSFYSVLVDGKRVTVEVTHGSNGSAWVSETAGRANRATTDEELAAMDAFFRAIGAEFDPDAI